MTTIKVPTELGDLAVIDAVGLVRLAVPIPDFVFRVAVDPVAADLKATRADLDFARELVAGLRVAVWNHRSKRPKRRGRPQPIPVRDRRLYEALDHVDDVIDRAEAKAVNTGGYATAAAALRTIDVPLTPAAARALASMLNHLAIEAEVGR